MIVERCCFSLLLPRGLNSRLRRLAAAPYPANACPAEARLVVAMTPLHVNVPQFAGPRWALKCGAIGALAPCVQLRFQTTENFSAKSAQETRKELKILQR